MKRKKAKQRAAKPAVVKALHAPPPTQEVKAELRADDDGMAPPPGELERPPA